MTHPHDAGIAWLQAQQPALDQILAEAGRSYYERIRAYPNARLDLLQSTDEAYGLSQGKDLCYDRPTVGLMYGLWYHARRVNTSLSLVLHALRAAQGQRVQVYDLGAGTGALQWALALGCAALEAGGGSPPRLRIVNIDTSPFMLHYLEHLWQRLRARYPICARIQHESRLNTWSCTERPYSNTWLCASYLFDHEDKQEDLSRDFGRLVGRLQPERVILSTSRQEKKVAFMSRIGEGLGARGYVPEPTADVLCFHDDLPAVNALRRHYQTSLHIPRIQPNASWTDHSFAGFSYVRRQATLFLDDAHRDLPGEVNLFKPHVTDRTRVELSEEQRRAARANDRPALIIGPAGCGKSVVITERVKNVVEAHDYSRSLHLLVTTFNKKLLKDVLRPWLLALLDPKRVKCRRAKASEGEACYNFFFDGSDVPNIRLMHFDVLPTRVARVHEEEQASGIRFCKDPSPILERAIGATEEVLQAKGHALSRFRHVLDPEYVYREFHRIYFGRLETAYEPYLDCARPGRPSLDRRKPPRMVLWHGMQQFLRLCAEEYRVHTPTHRRLRLYRYLSEQPQPFRADGREADVYVDRPFTHLFVDELQDCTVADFQIFYKLLADENQLVVAGDLAQSIHLGLTSSTRNFYRASAEQRNFAHHELAGSYRLPFRISEALVPLSVRIQGRRAMSNSLDRVSLQNPYRGSPPGARPIFVWAPGVAAVAEKIASIYDAYGPSLGHVGFKLEWCSVLEKDPALRRALDDAFRRVLGERYDKKRHAAETDTILRLKGLEKTCVVWSTRVPPESEEEAEELVYTILTRGARLLIVALFPETCEVYKPIINTFEAGRTILWDEETRQHLAECRSDQEGRSDYEDHPAPVWEEV